MDSKLLTLVFPLLIGVLVAGLESWALIKGNGLCLCWLNGGLVIALLFFCIAGLSKLSKPFSKVRIATLFFYNNLLTFIITLLTFLSVGEVVGSMGDYVPFGIATLLSFILNSIIWFSMARHLSNTDRWSVCFVCSQVLIICSLLCGITNFIAFKNISPSYMGGMIQVVATNLCVGLFISAVMISGVLLFLRREYVKQKKSLGEIS